MIGEYRLSSEVAHPAAAASSREGRISAPTVRLGDGVGGGGGGNAGKFFGKFADAMRQKEESVSAEVAQKEQAALSEFTQGLYQRKETGAADVVKDFDAQCQKMLKEAGANLDPGTRAAFERRMSPWIAGRRENLLAHQYREMRIGRANALDNDMRATAATETNDILALSETERRDWERRLAYGAKPEIIDAERKEAYGRHFAQMEAMQGAFETRYADAVREGVYGAEEARGRLAKSRHDAAKTLLDAAVQSGDADFAEYVIDRIAAADAAGKAAGAAGKAAGAAGKAPDGAGNPLSRREAALPAEGLSRAEGALPAEGLSRAEGALPAEGLSRREAAFPLSADELAGWRASVQGLRRRKAEEADAAARAAEKEAVAGDVDAFNRTVVSALDANFVPPFSKEEKLAEISRDARLSPAARQQRMAQWGAWFDAREADAAERKKAADKAAKDAKEDREKNGYEMPLADGTSVWISASRWGTTQADVHDWFTTDAIARDPVKAIARAEALKATGSISKEDYTQALATATAFQSPKVVDAANKALGGSFFKLADKKKPNKALPDYADEGVDFADDLAYKYDPAAASGFSGAFRTRGLFGGERPSSMAEDMRQPDETGERLFTPEEKTNLFRAIGRMVARGYTQEEIDGCVRQLVAPKMQEYYAMTMAARLADESFVRSVLDSVQSFDAEVSATVSKTTNRNISKVQ